MHEAHEAAADFYNASSPVEMVFGQNMTTLTLHMSRCLAHDFKAGDEIVLSRMDHDANVAPWLLVAEDKGLTVRWMDFDPDSTEFADDALERVLSEKTRLVAFCYASNCTGTINDVKRFCAQARDAGALSYVDAVQFAPHGVIDVQALGCDFLVSSSYKWFGPHLGILYGRQEVLEESFAYRVRPAGVRLPGKFETGTGPRETYQGMLGALVYLAALGEGASRRDRLVAGMNRLHEYEMHLTRRLIAGLQQVKGLTIHGITSENALHRRVPTVSFTLQGHHPDDLAKAFAPRQHLRVVGPQLRRRAGHPHGADGLRRRVAGRPCPLQHRCRGRHPARQPRPHRRVLKAWHRRCHGGPSLAP